MTRLGLFGGSFNPVHNGHLHLAAAAREALSLDQVIFVPAHCSPFKTGHPDMAPDADRLRMCELATEDLDWCTVDDCELQREGVSYSVDTVHLFHDRNPEAALYWLMGSDMFLSFTKWYHWQEILQYAGLCVLAREEDDVEKLQVQREALAPYGQIFLCNAPVFPISSTKIRENLRNGVDCSCYLPKKVVQYNEVRRLYT